MAKGYDTLQGIRIPQMPGGSTNVPPRRHMTLGKTIKAQSVMVEFFGEPSLNQIRMNSWAVAERISQDQKNKGNPPQHMLIDGRPGGNPLLLRHQIDVFYGAEGEDMRPILMVVAGIITNQISKFVSGVTWRWLVRYAGNRYAPLPASGPINGDMTTRFMLVPSGGQAQLDKIAFLNIAYRLGFDISGEKLNRPHDGVRRASGFIRLASLQANARVKPRYSVAARWAEKYKTGGGTPSSGKFNSLRSSLGVPTVRPRVQGVPIFFLHVSVGKKGLSVGSARRYF